MAIESWELFDLHFEHKTFISASQPVSYNFNGALIVYWTAMHRVSLLFKEISEKGKGRVTFCFSSVLNRTYFSTSVLFHKERGVKENGDTFCSGTHACCFSSCFKMFKTISNSSLDSNRAIVPFAAKHEFLAFPKDAVEGDRKKSLVDAIERRKSNTGK